MKKKTKQEKIAEIERNITCLIDFMERWYHPQLSVSGAGGNSGGGGTGYYSTIQSWRRAISKLLSET